MAKFEETNTRTMEIINYPLIYFLIKNNEVIYVGQTKHGLGRPLSHRDKDFDRLEILRCRESELDLLEDIYILKYQPIHNVKVNDGYKLITARNKLRKMLNNNAITIRNIKKIMSACNLSYVIVGNNEYITNETLGRIYEVLKRL